MVFFAKLKEVNERKNNELKDTEKATEGYLVCDICGGYYKLKPGESPDDFESCECGGSLKHTKTFKEDHSD